MGTSQAPQYDLLNAVLSAHGGLDRFKRISSISVTTLRSGRFFALKGYPNSTNVTAHISTRKSHVVFYNLTGRLEEQNVRYIWTATRVWKERPDGTVSESADNPRQTLFKGHRFDTPWNDLHLLWFSGYALWNYFVTPFCFTWKGFRTREVESYRAIEAGEGQTWRVLEVIYPDDFVAHTKTQKFFFDSKFRLRREDYVVDIARGSGAAHYCLDERNVDGLLVPRLRRVVSKDLDGLVDMTGPSMVLLNLMDVVVREDKSEAKL